MIRERAQRGYLPRVSIISLLWLVSAQSLLAQPSESPPAAAKPSAPPIEIVVTGSRAEEPLSRAASATEVVHRAEIERSGARDAAEILEERGGLQIVRTFSGSQLQLRGLDPQYSLVLIDSDRVPGAVGGGIDLTRYGADSIERIEIVRGPGSALYGADAIGGVINIITRESKRDFEADALASYGQHNTLTLTGWTAGHPVAPLRLQLTADLLRSDAYRRDNVESTTLSARNQWSVGSRAALAIDPRNTLVLRGDYMRSDTNGVDDGAGGAIFDRTQLSEQLRTSLEHRLRASRFVRVVSRASYSQYREQYLNDQRGSSALDRYEDNREQMGQLNTLVRIEPSAANRTTIGMEELFQRLDSARLSQSGNRFRFGAYGQHAWLAYRRGESEFEIVPGIRLDADSGFGTQLAPKLALRYKLSATFEMRASYGRGFRAPTFQELLLRFENPSVGYVVIGNPKLGAETSHGFDLGARYFTDVFEIGLTLFRNDLRNMITTVTSSETAAGLIFTYDNLTHASTMGAEASFSAHLTDVFSAGASYTLLDTWDGENHRKLEGRPPHRLTANVRAMYPAWELELVVRGAVSIGRVYYVEDEATGNAAEITAKLLSQIDLRVAKHWGRRLEVFAGINNLLNAGDKFSALLPFTVYGGLRGRY